MTTLTPSPSNDTSDQGFCCECLEAGVRVQRVLWASVRGVLEAVVARGLWPPECRDLFLGLLEKAFQDNLANAELDQPRLLVGQSHLGWHEGLSHVPLG